MAIHFPLCSFVWLLFIFLFALSTSVVFLLLYLCFAFFLFFFFDFAFFPMLQLLAHISQNSFPHSLHSLIYLIGTQKKLLMYLIFVWKQIISQSMVTQFLFSFVCRSYWLVYCLFSNCFLIASKNGGDFSLLLICVPAFYFRVRIHLWRVKLAALVLMDFLYGHTFPGRTNEIIFVLHWLGYSLLLYYCLMCLSLFVCQLLFKLFIISTENKKSLRDHKQLNWTVCFSSIIKAWLERLHSTIV